MNRIAIIALVFASLALAQAAPSWRFYPMNSQDMNTGKVQAGHAVRFARDRGLVPDSGNR